jgi:folate-binding protein YgfZ
LRSKVILTDATVEFAVALLYGPDLRERFGLNDEPGAAKPWEGGVVYVDPRLPALGARAILPRARATEMLARAGLVPGNAADYDRLRLSLGVPDGSRDLPVEKAILLENGFDELHGIDWQKGCYMGQELTARTKYRGLVRKRLLPVEVDGPLPAPGTPVMAGAKEAGEMRSGIDGLGLALLRLEHLDDVEGLHCGNSRLKPHKPAWANL